MMCSLNNEGRSVVGGFVQHAPPSRCETPPCVEYVCVFVLFFFLVLVLSPVGFLCTFFSCVSRRRDGSCPSRDGLRAGQKRAGLSYCGM